MRHAWIIIRNEMLIFSRDRKLLWLLLMVWTGWTISLLLASAEYKALYNEKQEANRTARLNWLEQGEKNPHSAGHTGTVLFKPIPPLFVFDHGLTYYLGDMVVLETHSQHETEGRKINRVASVGRMAFFTPQFIMQQLVPLLIFFLTYNSVSGEKESGTLRLILSQHISAKTVFRGKWCAGAVKILILSVPLYLITLALLMLLPGFTVREYLHFHLVFMVYLGYYFMLLFFSVTISGLAKSSRQALVILAGFWIVTSICLPAILVTLSENFFPAPSGFALKKRFDEGHGNKHVYGYRSMESFRQRYDKVQSELMQRYGVKRPDSLKVNTFGFVIEETEEEGQRIYDSTYGLVQDAFDRQENFRRLAHIISPAAVLQTVSANICGTGNEEHLNFIKQAELYRRNMMKTLNMDIAYHSDNAGYHLSTRSRDKKVYTRGRDLWEYIPLFVCQPVSLRVLLMELWPEWLILLSWSVLAFLIFTVTSERWHR